MPKKKKEAPEPSEAQLVFGANIKAIRGMMNLEQADLSKLLGYSPTSGTLSSIEHGRIMMKQEKILKLSEVSGVPVDAIMSTVRLTEDHYKMLRQLTRICKHQVATGESGLVPAISAILDQAEQQIK